MAEMVPPLNERGNWQEAIDSRLQERLMRPLVKPGIIDSAQLAGRILSQQERFANRMPLLPHLQRRLEGVKHLSASQVPIVYAQSVRNEASSAIAPAASPVPRRAANPVIQAKFDTAGAIAPRSFAEVPPLPPAQSQAREAVQSQEPKRASLQAEALPVVYAKPVAGEVRNTGAPVVSDNLQPPVIRANPVAQAIAGTSNNVTPSGEVSAEAPPLPARSLSGETASPLPVVVAASARAWVEPQPHPLLRNQTPANSASSVPPSGTDTPLIFSVPPSAAVREQQASQNPGATARAYNPIVGQSDRATPGARKIVTGRPVADGGDRSEEKSAPNTDKTEKIDVDALADKIERKLMRRLVVENERRGRGKWR